MGSNDTGSGIGMSDYSAAAQVSYSDGFTVGPSSSTTSGVSNPGTFVYPSGFQIWGKTPNPSLAAPASLSASIPAAGQVNLSWATFSGATDYVVQYKTAVASSYSNSFLVSGQTTASITGLTSSTSYNFRVFARTATNSTSSANIGNSTITATPQRTPSAPSITGITPGNTTLSVAFNPPSTDGGATITNYQYSTDGGLNWRTRDSGTTGSPLVINTTSATTPATLVNGTTYNVQIRAVNVVGNGAATASTTGTPTFPSCSPTTNPSPPSGFTVLTFTNTSTCNWSVPAGVTQVQYLAVAGGGGGAGGQASEHGGGGGGAGGLLSGTLNVTTSTISVLVGAGGTGGASGARGTSGSNSSFGTGITAVGGGAAGGEGSTTVLGLGGGSGGGGGGSATLTATGGTNTAGQGNVGGNGFSVNSISASGGGGGGAGAAGANAGSGNPTAGGVGLSTYSSWGLVTGTGENVSGVVYYAGGGAGAGGGLGRSGGLGGGGASSASATVGTSGISNSGGGGGGNSLNATPGSGGSGVIIIRYLKD
jgi:hypothetical protein